MSLADPLAQSNVKLVKIVQKVPELRLSSVFVCSPSGLCTD